MTEERRASPGPAVWITGAVLDIPDRALIALFLGILAVYAWRAGPEVIARLRRGGGDDS